MKRWFKRIKSIVFSCIVFLGGNFFIACSTNQSTPEDCVKTYAQYLSQGKIEAAKNLCTPAGQAFLTALSGVIIASETTLDSSEIIIKSIQCHQQTIDSVYCVSIEDDGFEAYEKTYWLVQQNDKWLIDQPTAKGMLEKSEEVLEEE